MYSDKWFAVKIALFNSLGFFVIAAGVTYVDARLTTHLVFGARHYPAGYPLSVIGAVIIFFITMFAILKPRSWKVKVVLPSLTLIIMDAISLPFFRPEFPHGGLAAWILYLAIASLFSCLIRFLPFEANRIDWLAASDIITEAKIERVKEYANLWRTIAVSITIGYLGVLIPWINFTWTQAPYIVKAPAEIFLLSQAGVAALAGLSMYVLFGIIYEAFRKAHVAAELLFQIKK